MPRVPLSPVASTDGTRSLPPRADFMRLPTFPVPPSARACLSFPLSAPVDILSLSESPRRSRGGARAGPSLRAPRAAARPGSASPPPSRCWAAARATRSRGTAAAARSRSHSAAAAAACGATSGGSASRLRAPRSPRCSGSALTHAARRLLCSGAEPRSLCDTSSLLRGAARAAATAVRRGRRRRRDEPEPRAAGRRRRARCEVRRRRVRPRVSSGV